MRLYRSFLTLLYAGAAGFAAAPAWAEESEAAKKAGLPQLDASFFPSQIFWLVLTFGILYLLMSRIGLPGVERVQQKREGMISIDLEAANTANENAKKTIAEYEKILADARMEASKASNTAAIAQEAATQQAAQQKVLMKTVHEADGRIMAARDAALREAKGQAAEIANAVIEKITGLKIQVRP